MVKVEAEKFYRIESENMEVPGLTVVDPKTQSHYPLAIQSKPIIDDKGRKINTIYVPVTASPEDLKESKSAILRTWFDNGVSRVLMGAPSDGTAEAIQDYNDHAKRVIQEGGDLYGFPLQIAYEPQP